MKTVTLYFPDSINLKAFVLLEEVKYVEMNPEESKLAARLNEAQLAKAFSVYGAKMYK